jgi:predicted dehydrogenase
LAEVRPDVVHITTPPQSHYDLAVKCLEFGCHVFLEKPFALSSSQVNDILDLAVRKNLKVTVNHCAQFSPAMNRMREKVRVGYLGGTPVHMEVHYCFDIENPVYAQAMVGDQNHWERKLPGGMIQNIISHAITKVAEFMETETPVIKTLTYRSPNLEAIGEKEVCDELRTIIHDGKNTSAYLTFSTQLKPPSLHQFIIYGQKNSIYVDHNTQTCIGLDGVHFKSYLNFFYPPLRMATKYLRNMAANVAGFLKKEIYADYGTYYLTREFYRAVRGEADVPVSYRQIRLTYLIMDHIIQQIKPLASDPWISKHR